MRYSTILPALCMAIALSSGCGGSGSFEADPTPTPTPEITPQAFVLTSDFAVGSFATIDLEPPRAVTPARAGRDVDPDAVARAINRRVYVINRSEATLEVLDPADDYATLSRCSTGADTNPHDIAVVGDDKAYITLYNETELLIVDPSVGEDCVGFVRGRIDLSVFADGDGIPEMDLMAIIGDRLYVSIQHLDRDNFFAPTGLGQIAVIDIASNRVIGEIALGAQNPFGVTKGLTVVEGEHLFIPLAGKFGVADGGIQRVDAVNQELLPFVITEAELGGDVTDVAVFSPTIAYAVISKADFSNAVVQFNPATGRLVRTVLSADFIADIELNDRDELYVSDHSSGSEGVRIFNASDATEITTTPLALGTPAGPTEIVFVP